MTEFGSQILNGLAIGSVYALLALGFSLVFGVANLINFAQGSLFMMGAYLGWTAATIWQLPLPLAALVAILLTSLLGLVIDWLALRPLQGGPAITPLLSTLAVSVVLDQGAELIWGPETRAFPNPLAATVYGIGGAFISAVDLLILATALVTMALLVLFLQRTWLGRALRATAQDPDAAAQMGVEISNMRRYTFGLAGAVGGIGGVLVGMYFQSIFPAMGLPYGLKGFAAALLGGIGSIPGSIAGGLLLGIFESLAGGYVGGEYRDLVAYALLLTVLLWRPQGLLGRSSLEALGDSQAAAGAIPSTSPLARPAATALVERYSRWCNRRPNGHGSWKPSNRQWLALGLVAALLPLFVSDPYLIQVALIGLIFALLAAGLTLISGTAGQISLGHATLFGVGAYATAILARTVNVPTELIMIAAGLLAAALGIAFALPTHRLSGHAVAVATLAAGQIVYLIILTWIPVTRGPMGIPGIPAPQLVLAGRAPLWDVRAQYWLALALTALAVLSEGRLFASPLGRTWRAIREDRLAAQASGIPVRRYLVLAFACGGFLAGIAGALYAYLLTFVSPDSFATDTSLTILAMTVLGGLGNLAGAVFAGALLAVVPEFFRSLADWRMIGYGLLLLLLVRFRPQGLAGTD
jgi:branched-chain amino acid transport system permease protein